MRNIWKVNAKEKEKLNHILNICNKGDIILLSPGEYYFPNGLPFQNVKDIKIIGLGKVPSEVVIKGYFYISGAIKVSISNVTINALHQGNALNINEDATVELNKVIVNGELTGVYPAISCNQSRLIIKASEVYFSKDESYGIDINEQSEVEIRSSIIDSITSVQSNVNLHNNQINVAMAIMNDSIVTSTGIFNIPTNHTNYYDYFVFVQSGSIVEFDVINANNNVALIKVEHSVFSLNEMKVADNSAAEVYYNKQSTIDVSDERVDLINLDDEKVMQQVGSIDSLNQNDEMVDTNMPDFYDTINSSADEDVYEKDYYPEYVKVESGLEELTSLYGLHDLKLQVDQFINSVKYNQMQKEQGRDPIPLTLHSIFRGNPGTGKTTVARLLGRTLYESGVILNDTFVEVTRKDLVSPHIGETAKITQEVLESSKGGILFIDEAYSLYSESAMDYGKEAIDTMIPFMEENRYNTMIIFAGYTDEINQFVKMNSGLESRIKNKFDFEDYKPEEIAEIGYMELIKQDYNVNEQKYKDVIKWLYSHSINKSNARWVRNMNEQILLTLANRVVESNAIDTQTITDEDLDILTGNQKLNKADMIQDLLNQLDSLIGLDGIKKYVHRLIKEAKVNRMLMDTGSFSGAPTYHMIFSGNPGTGKTTVAKIIAQLFYCLDIMPTSNVKVVDRSDLVGPYIGHTEKRTKEVLEQAMGGVLFIDEAYQLAGGSSNDFGKKAIETLVTYLEEHRDKFVVILAGYTEEMAGFLDVNPGLRSRISNNVIFHDHSPDEIATIVEQSITKDWEVNVRLLRSKVIDIYTNLPSNEKANARWARNFSEKLIQNHKVWLIDQDTAIDQIKNINDEVVREIH